MKKLITEADIDKLIKSGSKELIVSKDTLITPSAKDKIYSEKIKLVSETEMQKVAESPCSTNGRVFTKIAIAGDHTGLAVRKALIKMLKDGGYEVIDLGTNSDESCDYPDFAFAAAVKVIKGEACAAILVDATGIPSAMAANKFPGIRAAVCYNEFSARSSREHNNANIISVGALSLGLETIKSTVNIWLKTGFLGDRHQRRLDKISELEKKLIK